MIRSVLPLLYIEWYEDLEKHSLGPYYSISPDGSGNSLGQSWVAYKVQTPSLKIQRVIVPHEYHTIVAKNDICYDDGTKPDTWPPLLLKVY